MHTEYFKCWKPLAQCHIPEEQNPLPHGYENIGTHGMWQVFEQRKIKLHKEFFGPFQKWLRGSILPAVSVFC
jgi:hypothetical protein